MSNEKKLMIIATILFILMVVCSTIRSYGYVGMTYVEEVDNLYLAAKVEDPNDPCKDKLICDPNDPCYNPDHPDIYLCDPNLICKGKLECDPNDICYNPDHPDLWLCFYEYNPQCSEDEIICDFTDECFNRDYPDIYDICCNANCVTAVFMEGDISVNTIGNSNIIRWETAQEIDNFGFYIYRSVNGSDLELISKLIRGSMGIRGREYMFTDEYDSYGDICYYVEDVDYSDVRTMHGPVCIRKVKSVIEDRYRDPYTEPTDDSTPSILQMIKSDSKSSCFINLLDRKLKFYYIY